jgi:hypothetical protein
MTPQIKEQLEEELYGEWQKGLVKMGRLPFFGGNNEILSTNLSILLQLGYVEEHLDQYLCTEINRKHEARNAMRAIRYIERGDYPEANKYFAKAWHLWGERRWHVPFYRVTQKGKFVARGGVQ